MILCGFSKRLSLPPDRCVIEDEVVGAVTGRAGIDRYGNKLNDTGCRGKVVAGCRLGQRGNYYIKRTLFLLNYSTLVFFKQILKKNKKQHWRGNYPGWLILPKGAAQQLQGSEFAGKRQDDSQAV
ncbi:MAG: hypothetical protein SOT60_07870 [Bilifractor sp.]|nr:hypothetical protein [Lachnospiraceae bacterium]MDY2837837.1 hypothetical protein [Bilifractor sp.]